MHARFRGAATETVSFVLATGIVVGIAVAGIAFIFHGVCVSAI